MVKVVVLEGRHELEKLEKQGAKVKFKVLVRNHRVRNNGRLTVRSDTPTNGAAIIAGIADFVAVCKIGLEIDEAEMIPVATQLDM